MDPRIAKQRRGAITAFVFLAVAFGIITGITIASGLGWMPISIARTERPVQVEPSDFLLRSQESFRDIVAAVRPAVVSIQAEGVETAGFYPDPFEFQDPFERFFDMPDPRDRGPERNQERDRDRERYERMYPSLSSGSGFIVDPDGHILTNNHVVTGAERVRVVLEDARQFDAEIVGTDPDTDVAILKIEDDDPLPYISLGDSDQLQVGDWVMAIGNPFGNLAGTVTVGIVSATNREYLNLPNEPYYQDFIQTDAAINLGNSGGPLVDLYGRAVGINTAIAAQGSGIGFAIPIDLAKFVYESYLERGEVIRGWIGVTIQNIDPDLAGAFGLGDARGAMVAEVREGDPADQGGLQDGDIILEVDSRSVVSVQSASRLIAALPVGEPAEFLVFRDGEEFTLTITPVERDTGEPRLYEEDLEEEEERDEPRGPAKNEQYLGIEVQELTDNLSRRYEIPEDTTGVVVTYVDPMDIGFEKGLREGVVIVSINHSPVESLDDYQRLMADAYEAWQENESTVVVRYLVFSVNTGTWVRQYMALPFE